MFGIRVGRGIMLNRIGKDNYLKLLKTYNFNIFPRMIGNPGQRVVINYDELWDCFMKWNGQSACFNSHNALFDIQIIRGKSMPQIIYHTSIHHDFDSSDKIENAQNDCIQLSKISDNENIPHLNVFTGGKGFQCFLLTKPHKYKFDAVKIMLNDGTSMSNQDSVKDITRGIQKYFKHKLNLRTIDGSCIGTPKKQSRALYCWHKFTRSAEDKGTVAIPLTDEQLYDWNITEIIEYSKNPEFIIPEIKGTNYMTLTEVFEYFDINLCEQKEHIDYAEYKPIDTKITDETALLFLDVVSEHKCCISSAMMSHNPDHRMRLSFAAFAKKLGKSREWFKQVYEAIGSKIPYVDIHNIEERDYQIDWIFDNYYFNEANCNTIKDWDLCLKNKCRRYMK